MKDDKKVPQLRFPEFTDAWKQRKLSDISEKITEKNTELKEQETLTNSAELGIISQSDFFDHRISNESNINNYYVVSPNDFVYNPRISVTAPVGPINRNKLKRTGIMSPLYTVFKTHDIDCSFLEFFFKSSSWHKFMHFNGDSGARSDRFSIKDNVFFTMPIFVPSLSEQVKIGELLSKLDNTITLQQRKLNSLQKLKKGLLQKMFPKNGENIPEIRFPEFSDAWKQRELGEIAERVTRRNSSLESQTPLTISAEYGLIDQNKFFGKRIAAKDLSNYYLIQKGEFAYNKSTSNDAPWGAIKRLDCYNNGALSTLYIVFKIKDNKSCYSDFLVTYYGTSLWHKEVKEIASEGARNHGLLNVSPSDFFRTKLVIPQDFEEQRKIGAFFTQLDNTITLQQRKLESLQKLKKGLLQQMFI